MVRVSVIVSVFNGAEVICSALDSIKNQIFRDWECIICDDGSTDNTWEIVRDFTKQGEERFVCIRNQENRGPAYARNRCIEAASGEYIAIQDADDISLPERFAKQVEFLDANRGVSAVGTYSILMNDAGEKWGINKPPRIPVKESWIKGPQVIHASTMIRKEDLLHVGKYDETLRKAEDYDLWIRFLEKGYRIETIPEILYCICSDIFAYGRKGMDVRIKEVIVRYRTMNKLSIPCYYAVYLLKPIFLGAFPSGLLRRYHHYLFSKNLL